MTSKNDQRANDWTNTENVQSPSQPGPTNENPNAEGSGADSRGEAPAPSTGNQQGGATGDTSGAPAGTV